MRIIDVLILCLIAEVFLDVLVVLLYCFGIVDIAIAVVEIIEVLGFRRICGRNYRIKSRAIN